MPPAPRKTPGRTAAKTNPAGDPLPAVKSALEPAITAVILDDADTVDEEIELVELVRVNGKPLMVPARPPAGLALQVIDDIVTYNEGVAAVKLLRTLLGEEQWADLTGFKGLKASHLKQLAKGVTTLTLGAMDEDDPGN